MYNINIIIMNIAQRLRSFIIDERHRVTQREPSTWAQRQNTSPARSRTSSARDTKSVISERHTHPHTHTQAHSTRLTVGTRVYVRLPITFFFLLIRFSHCSRSVDGFHGTHTRSRARPALPSDNRHVKIKK